jgi:membrane protein DedA with SNARE-associated domain
MIGSSWAFLQTVISDLQISVGFGIGMFFESLGIPFAAAPMLVVASARSSSDPITYLLSVPFGSIGATLGSMLS